MNDVDKWLCYQVIGQIIEIEIKNDTLLFQFCISLSILGVTTGLDRFINKLQDMIKPHFYMNMKMTEKTTFHFFIFLLDICACRPEHNRQLKIADRITPILFLLICWVRMTLLPATRKGHKKLTIESPL